ncbi:fatty acid desaturase [Tsukamurella strandjordii]|uniref:fatty acid desaturase n=1 Tax=Tsukamurella strandjordii TaxID=147577 RepID=UPI003F72CD96
MTQNPTVPPQEGAHDPGPRDLHRARPEPPGGPDGARPDPDSRPGPGPGGPGPGGGPQLSDVWVYKGRAYDLSEWINKHPGGEFFIGRSKNRDITSIIGSYHKDPEKIERMLERFALDRDARIEDVHPKNNAPAFLFKDGFDSWRDTPRYRFDDPDDLLHQVKKRLRDPALAARITRMDRWFDVAALALAVTYVAVIATRLSVPAWMPLPLFVIAMVVLRSSLAGFGHYAIHRAQKGKNKVLVNAFDINYVALSFVTADGHALLHHPHTQSEVDIKKNVFTMMMDIPRWYRVPIHTLHKFGHTATGMTSRLFEIVKLTRQVGVADMYGSLRGALPHFVGAFGMRVLLIGEFFLFLFLGDIWAWVAQFVAVLWVSTFLVVASHDFETDVDELPEPDTEDWAVNQLHQAYDLKISGNRYVDCFLSAGLSSHRVHHVLPYQRSGFANIATERVMAEEAAKFGVEWLPARSFFFDRLPDQVRTFLFSKSRTAQAEGHGFLREHFSPKALRTSGSYVVAGFTGIGTV